MDAQTRLEIQNLTEQQQQYVIQTLPVKEKSLSSAYIFWVLFGAHYFYLNKPFKNIFLWALCYIYIGFVWWLFDLFRMKSLVAECNPFCFTPNRKNCTAKRLTQSIKLPEYPGYFFRNVLLPKSAQRKPASAACRFIFMDLS